MNKLLFLVLFVTSVSVLLSSQTAFAGTETIFDEDFDTALAGWNQSLCIRNDPANQVCQIGQDTKLFNQPPNDNPPNSLPNWGFVEIFDAGINTGPGSAEVRYQKIFNVATEDDYDISAVLGVKDCVGTGICNIESNLYIDGVLIFQQAGPDFNGQPPLPSNVFFEMTTIHLTSGSHDVELGMFSPEAFGGNFRGSFDDVLIQRDVPDELVGGELIPIETTSLILAGSQTFSWMIPVVLSGIGIGLFVFRKSKNS